MNGKQLVPLGAVLAAVVLLGILLPVGTMASTWCGDNGLIRFSFVQGDSLVTVLHSDDSGDGVTSFELYAWLTDFEPVARDREAFLHVGGFELKLSITGAEAFILEQDFPSKVLNVGKEMGHIAVGLDPGEKIRDNKVFLVRWKVMIQGRPENVRIGLDPTGLMSCETLEGCPDCEPLALYVGNQGSRQLGYMFVAVGQIFTAGLFGAANLLLMCVPRRWVLRTPSISMTASLLLADSSLTPSGLVCPARSSRCLPSITRIAVSLNKPLTLSFSTA